MASTIYIKSPAKQGIINWLDLKKNMTPWLFVLPGLVFTLWLKYYPMLRGIIISFYEYNVSSPPGEFTGIKNYIAILQQQAYWDSWKNTFVFLLLGLAIGFIPPIIQAIMLSEITRGRKLFSTIYLIPALIPTSVAVILWKWIWNPDIGLANAILKIFGIPPQLWLNSITQVKFAIAFPGILGGGVVVLILLAAILGIPYEIYESAMLDGCTGLKRVFYIILPNIRFIISVNLIMTVITTLQLLDGVFQYTGGGPAFASRTVGMFIYDTFYHDLSYGRSNAASVILLAVISLLTVIQLRMNKSEAQ